MTASNTAIRQAEKSTKKTSSPASKKNSSTEKRSNRWHEKILSLREELCKLVEGVSTGPSETNSAQIISSQFELVTATLDPFFVSLSHFDEDHDVSNNEIDDGAADALLFRGISPLVFACDRGNLACLLYFCEFLENEAQKINSRGKSGIFWEALIGSPLKSKTVPDETTAFHHCTTKLAIQAEQLEGTDGKGITFLELLERICIAQESLRGGNGSSESNSSNQLVLALGEAVNSHYDTPLMMAVTNHNLIEGGNFAKVFVERWYMRALQGFNSKEVDVQKQNISRVLSLKNHNGNTVLSYAWQDGNMDLVKWLIDIDNGGGAGIVTLEETLRFREYTDGLRKHVENNSAGKTETEDARNLYKKLVACEECTKLLELFVQRRSEEMAEKLLAELGGDTGTSAQKPTKRKKKKKKKQKSIDIVAKESHNVAKKEQPKTRDFDQEENHKSTPFRNTNIESTTEDVLSLTKLANGRVAVKVPGHDLETKAQQIPTLPVLQSPWYRKRTFSLDETNQLLRDRYKQGSTKENSELFGGTACTPQMTRTPSQSSDADSVLSALCLDVNCLLYSDHGMALNLSPAQLDAVEQILREQLQSVSKARILQVRRCKSSTSSSLYTTNET